MCVLVILSLNRTEWLNTNEVVVEVLKRLGESHCPSAKQSQGQKKIVYVCVEETERGESMCEFTVCVCVCV